MSLFTQRVTLQRVLIASWAAWYSSVVSTNFTDLLKTFGLLPESFGWVSGNFEIFVGRSKLEGAARMVVIAVYIGGWLWEVATALLLWRALALSLRAPEHTARNARPAFLAALSFWGVFMLLAQIFGARTEPIHLSVFSALCLSLLIVELLPERSG
ncbi:MAG: hypothetical protein H6741_24455 [Alphaproteobacteria bacterium]|nr:hypothetical protein [Alphaproteobacteria bacterium]MCB9795861.1 hypothetical protein [Alphaproteobacteria bacterium]